jgi:hypothetical protein
MDLDSFKLWAADHGLSCVGTWRWLPESLTGFSHRVARPWLVIADEGPVARVVPRSTKVTDEVGCVRHAAHEHAEFDKDRRTCRIDKAGCLVVSVRRSIAVGSVSDDASYSCREHDEQVLKAAGCR